MRNRFFSDLDTAPNRHWRYMQKVRQEFRGIALIAASRAKGHGPQDRLGSAEASLTCPEGGAQRKTSDAFLTAVLSFCTLCKSSKEMHR